MRIDRIVVGLVSIVALAASWVDVSAQVQTIPSDVVIEEVYVHNYSQYTIDNGLTSSYVTCIEKDGSGMMWIGTNDGVNSFDGYEFRTYLSDQYDSTTICGKKVCSIKEVAKNKIFMALADGGLTMYDKGKDVFKNIEIYGNNDDGEFRSAYGLCRFGDNAYVSYENTVVKQSTNSDEQINIVMLERQKHTGSTIERMVLDSVPGKRYIAMLLGRTTFGILDTHTETIKTLRLPNKVYLNDVCYKDKMHVYLCTTQGLYIYSIDTGKLSKDKILNDVSVQAMAKDYGIGYWIAYDNDKLMKWIPTRNKVKLVTNIGSFLNKQTTVTDMYEDDNEVLWLATSNAGLIKLDVKHPKIQNVVIDDSSLPMNYKTMDIFAYNSHEVWAACGIEGILKVDTKQKKALHMPIPHRNIYSIYVRKNGEVILGTTKGPFRYMQEENRVELLCDIYSDSLISRLDGRCVVNYMCEDCLGNMWFATQVGLYKYNGYTFERCAGASHGVEVVNVVYEDCDGRIWSGSESGSFVKETNTSEFVETSAGKINFGMNNSTFTFSDDRVGNVLIGTASGVLVYNKKTHEVKAADYNADFNNAMIYSIVCDENKVIWLSTNRGIGYIDNNYNQMYTFNHHDGLLFEGNECHRLTCFKNYIYVGNATNLNFILANKLNFNDNPPNCFVSGVLYGQSDKEFLAKMENDTLYTVKYLLRASLKIKVASSDFSLPSRNVFKYRIDNEGDWTQMKSGNEILISGPMPGTYKIEIMSTNSDKMWSADIKTIYVKVVPPLWLSNPAIIFYIILLLALTWFLIDIRFSSIKKRMRQIESEARSKKIVEAQRNRLAKLHKDQEDSIRYAKRIQDSIMPPTSSFEKMFNKLLVFYMPKDIVSGDFYSFYQRDDKTFIIAADCTGHGVPGAFISILGVDHLYNIIMRQQIDDAGKILTYLHRDLHSTVFKRDNSSEEFNEGMDLTICVVYHKERKINFAGAMNDLYIIRDNDILTYHGDRHSIGTNSTMGEVDEKEYTSHMIDCCPGDMFYMFSDGFVDQFGGPEFKKFKHRRFKQLLLYIYKLPAKDQISLLNRRFLEWKGANEQTDDVSVIGFEPWA